MTEDVTLVVTSCERFDLLERTLRSFVQFNTYPIYETLIIEDGPEDAPNWIFGLEGLGTVTWTSNGERRGQIFSIDRVYHTVVTPWIFHSEDDWQFLRPGFIEASLEIMMKHREIVQVWLREDCGHPAEKLEKYDFLTMAQNWGGGWSGFSFNPGLKRLADYQAIDSYAEKTKNCALHGLGHELKLNSVYRNLGYLAASLRPAYVQHIGQHRSRACEPPTQWRKAAK